jgi:hypothetical protein
LGPEHLELVDCGSFRESGEEKDCREHPDSYYVGKSCVREIPNDDPSSGFPVARAELDR